jgi:thiol-disulfide isomerase/thioredoxin
MANLKNISEFGYSNPLLIIIMLLIGLIVILAIFRSASPFLNIGFGINAHIGDLKGTFEIEAFDNNEEPNLEMEPFNNHKEPLFIMYYADWCGHCKRTKPEFEKLGDKYKNIKIVAINAEDPQYKDLVKSQGINGFPTIRLYPSGMKNKHDEYSGSRTYEDFTSYLNKVSSP